MTPEKLKTVREALEQIIALRMIPYCMTPSANQEAKRAWEAGIADHAAKRALLALLEGEDREGERDGASLIVAGCECRKALEQIQWGNAEFDPESGENGCEYNLCPLCDQSEVRGHAPDCLVGIALASPCCSQEVAK